jgi:hypothetical protein
MVEYEHLMLARIKKENTSIFHAHTHILIYFIFHNLINLYKNI